MFTEFTFKRFKSFKDSTLPVSPLTIIIGSNASGKSNAIEGMGGPHVFDLVVDSDDAVQPQQVVTVKARFPDDKK